MDWFLIDMQDYMIRWFYKKKIVDYSKKALEIVFWNYSWTIKNLQSLLEICLCIYSLPLVDKNKGCIITPLMIFPIANPFVFLNWNRLCLYW